MATYTRKVGATADDLVIQLYGEDDQPQDLTGTTARVVRLRDRASIDAAIEGAATGGQIRAVASALPDAAGTWEMETWVTFANGEVQKYPREGFDLLVMVETLEEPS